MKPSNTTNTEGSYERVFEWLDIIIVTSLPMSSRAFVRTMSFYNHRLLSYKEVVLTVARASPHIVVVVKERDNDNAL